MAVVHHSSTSQLTTPLTVLLLGFIITAIIHNKHIAQKPHKNIWWCPNNSDKNKEFRDNQRDRKGRRKQADGCVPGTFPILKDPKSFHEAHGHPSDEVTKMLCTVYYGNAKAVKGYANSCPYCLSRRRRIQPRLRAGTVDRVNYRMG